MIDSMPRHFRACLLLLVCSLITSGCFTSVTTIKVKPDGSGTIEQSIAMKAEAAAQLTAMAATFGDAAGKDNDKAASPPELFSDKDMREAATKFGEGVTFVSSQPIKTKDMVGRVATYSFADITKVRVNQKPPSPKGTPGEPASKGKGAGAEDVSFKFLRHPAGTSVVTVVFPEPDLSKKKDKDAESETESKKPDPTQLAMMKKMLDGLRIEIGLEVAGAIVKTNSPYVQGSKVTLLEMDFTELMTNDAVLGKLANPESIEEAKQLLKGVKGVKVNLDREVSVEFK
jgi:hypothetical protein